MTTIKFDPIRLAMLAVSNTLGIDCEISFAVTSQKRLWWRVGPWGQAVFPNEGQPYITICPHTPVGHVAEIIAHESAHIYAGLDSGHGCKWNEAFGRVQSEFNRLVESEEAPSSKLVML